MAKEKEALYPRDCSIEPRFNEYGEMVSAGHNSLGQELPDDVPTAPPLGYKPSTPLEDMIKRMIQGSLSERAAAEGAESFEEANDFDVEDEFDPGALETEYQYLARIEDMAMQHYREVRAAEKEAKDKPKAADPPKDAPPPTEPPGLSTAASGGEATPPPSSSKK